MSITSINTSYSLEYWKNNRYKEEISSRELGKRHTNTKFNSVCIKLYTSAFIDQLWSIIVVHLLKLSYYTNKKKLSFTNDSYMYFIRERYGSIRICQKYTKSFHDLELFFCDYCKIISYLQKMWIPDSHILIFRKFKQKHQNT